VGKRPMSSVSAARIYRKTKRSALATKGRTRSCVAAASGPFDVDARKGISPHFLREGKGHESGRTNSGSSSLHAGSAPKSEECRVKTPLFSFFY